MLGTGLCFLLKVLVLAGAAVALVPKARSFLQEECASKCPDLDLTQVGYFRDKKRPDVDASK